jgi:hypothetical protein
LVFTSLLSLEEVRKSKSCFLPTSFARGGSYTAMVIFPHFFARAKKRSQRKHAKGETGVIRRTKAELLSLLINPFPFGIPLTPCVKIF